MCKKSDIQSVEYICMKSVSKINLIPGITPDLDGKPIQNIFLHCFERSEFDFYPRINLKHLKLPFEHNFIDRQSYMSQSGQPIFLHMCIYLISIEFHFYNIPLNRNNSFECH